MDDERLNDPPFDDPEPEPPAPGTDAVGKRLWREAWDDFRCRGEEARQRDKERISGA
jgi:hypothetical protein